jgi:tetratricopeptide (TPR) repeat protein
MLVNEGVLVKKDNQWLFTSKIDIQKIPNNLQGLLTARIDRLSPEARTILRIASVIGRTFAERVLLKVIKDQAPDLELMEQLSTLESIGMIKVAQVNPELVYKFHHILLHDAAYHSIFEKDLADLHLNVGTALEELYPDQQEQLASALALHFLKGNHAEKALKYLDLAGHVGMDSYAHAEAEIYFNQALQLTDDPVMIAHLYTDLGEALAQQTKHQQAISAWENAIQYHRQLGNTDRLARVYAWMARSAWWGYDPKRSLQICLDGLESLEGIEESPDIAYLIHETGRAFLFNNQPEKAKAYCEQALDIAKRLNAYDVQAEVLATIGILPTIQPEQAIASLEMAIKLSEENKLYRPASRAYINLAAVVDNMGKVSLARDYRKRAIELGNKAGGITDVTMVNQAIASASLWLADFQDAEERIRHMRRVSRQSNAYLDENTLNLLCLEGNLARLKGELPAAIDSFTDLIDRSRQIQDLNHILQGNQALAEVIIESYLLNPERESKANIDIALSVLSDFLQTTEDNSSADKIPLYCLISEIYALKTDFEEAK